MTRAQRERVNLARIDLGARLVFLCVSANLLARTTNAIVGDALDRGTDGLSSEIVRPTRAMQESTPPLSALLDRNVFHARRASVPEPGPLPAPKGCVHTNGDRMLVATIVPTDRSRALAVLKDKLTDALSVLSLGAILSDGRQISGIDWRELRVVRGERCEILSLEETSEAIAIVPEQSPSADPVVKRVSENVFKMSRKRLDDFREHWATYSGDGRIVPVLESGRMIGVRLAGLRPEGVFTKLGAVEGDVLVRVNGIEVVETKRLFDLLGRANDLDTITFDVIRNGQPRTLTFQVE